MKMVRTAGWLLLALTLTLGFSACAKNAETEMTSTEEPPAIVAEPAPDAAPPYEATMTPPEPEPVPAKKPAAPRTASRPKSSSKPTTAVPASETRTVSLPVGATFDVELVTPVHTATSNVGDKVEGKLMQPLTADGMVIAKQGAVIRGEITDLKRASRSRSEEDRASVTFAFTSIETVEGEKTLAATVTNVDGKIAAGSTTKRDALIIGGSTVAGAVLGKVIGKDTKGAMIGAVGGAVVGTGVVMASKGHELELAAGSKISLRADQPITIVQR